MDYKRLILDILSTVKCTSGFVKKKRPSYGEAGKCLLRINEEFNEIDISIKKEYDSKKWAEISSRSFHLRLSTLEDQLIYISDQLYDKLPHKRSGKFKKSIRFDSVKFKCISSLGMDLNFYTKREHDKLNTVAFEVAKFEYSNLGQLCQMLSVIGKKKTILDALNEIIDQAAETGEYSFLMPFKKVADACRYYMNNLAEENCNKREIAEFIFNKAEICEDGVITDDKSVINKRIDSWRSHYKKTKGIDIPVE